MNNWMPLLSANVVAQLVLLVGAVWCIAVPNRRIYPMAEKGFVYFAMWGLFYFIFASNFAFVVFDWNSGIWTSPWRFAIGVPVALLGGACVTWEIATLGVKNTSGRPDGFVSSGPYAFTRNPQYLGDIFLFIGVAIIANSEVVLVTHLLTALIFVITPLAEEPWLHEQYGEVYDSYRRKVPRFL